MAANLAGNVLTPSTLDHLVAEPLMGALSVVEDNNETPIVPSLESFATAGTRGSIGRSGCIKRGGASGSANPSFVVAGRRTWMRGLWRSRSRCSMPRCVAA